MLKAILKVAIIIGIIIVLQLLNSTNKYQNTQVINVGDTFEYKYPEVDSIQTNCIKTVMKPEKVGRTIEYKYNLCNGFYAEAQNYILVAIDENYKTIKDQMNISLLNATETSYDNGRLIVPTDSEIKYIAVEDDLSNEVLALYQV